MTLAEIEPLTVTEHAYADRAVRLHAYIGRIHGGPATVSPGIEHRWVSVRDLVSLRLPPANEPITAAIIEHLDVASR